MAVSPESFAGKWINVGTFDELIPLGARVVNTDLGAIAVFRTAEGEVFALLDRCPHKAGPLSQGIVHGNKVSCPLHDWKISLATGSACEPDVGCTPSFPVRVVDGEVFVSLQAQ